LKRLVITDHARFEMERREITEEEVREVALFPQQAVTSYGGRRVYQSRVRDPLAGRPMLLRVVVVERGSDLIVITAYKTSQVNKYWQENVEP